MEVELFLLLWDKHYSMTQIPGVTIKENANGKITHITIDVEQQKELAQPVLKQLGITEGNDFDTTFANAQTLEKSEAVVIAAVKAHYASRH